MLTLVAEVLATDLLFDSVLENDRCDLLSSRSLSRNAMSETREEKDMVAILFYVCIVLYKPYGFLFRRSGLRSRENSRLTNRVAELTKRSHNRYT